MTMEPRRRREEEGEGEPPSEFEATVLGRDVDWLLSEDSRMPSSLRMSRGSTGVVGEGESRRYQ